MRIETRITLTSLAVLALVLASVLAINRLVYFRDLFEAREANARNMLQLVMSNLASQYDGLVRQELDLVSQVRSELAQQNMAVAELLEALRSMALGKGGGEGNARTTALAYLNERRDEFANVAVCDQNLAPLFMSSKQLSRPNWSGYRDLRGNDAFPKIYEAVRRYGKTYSVVLWPPSKGEPEQKNLVYATLFKPWNWLVCAYAPIHNLEDKVNAQKESFLNELKKLSLNLEASGQGYFSIAEPDGAMLVHPWVPQGAFSQAPPQGYGVSLLKLFREATLQGGGKVEYSWRSRQGVEEFKVAFVDLFRPLDWHVIYTQTKESMVAPARRLAAIELVVIASILLIASAVLYSILRKHTRPLREVTEALSKLPEQGFRMDQTELASLQSRHGRGGDEPAALLRTFGQMQHRLNRYVGDLDQAIQEKHAYAEELAELNLDLDRRVQERTADLSLANRRLQEEMARKQEAEQALSDSRRQLRLVVDGVPVSICYIDREERFLFVNERYARVSGVPPTDLIGRRIMDSAGEETMALIRPILQEAFLGREVFVEETMPSGPAAGRTLAASFIPHRGDDGEVASVIITIQDVTDRNNMERELVESRERAEAANRAKSMFLANMSHELRTPLGGVIGMLEAAMKQNPQEGLLHQLSAALDAAEHLALLVDDVLDFSRAEAGRMELAVENFSPARLVATIDQMLRPQFEKKGLELAWDLAPDLPQTLSGDPRRIKQVFINLLSNALKYSTEGGVDVRIEGEETEGGGLILKTRVKDAGPGIPEDKQESIFESFTQLEETGRRTHGGSGLGLALCRQLARLMGGDVTIRSKPGQGSEFTFTARVDVVEEPPAPADARPAPKPATADKEPDGRRILVAEDNPLNAELLTYHLSSLGHEAVCAEDGGQVLEILRTQPIDLILMDMEMPVINGLEAAKRIREGDYGINRPDIPIVAVTAHVLPEYRRMCKEAGMDDYLPKPVRLATLSQILERNLLKRH